MNCKKCGALLTENDVYCKSCGAPVNEGAGVQPEVLNTVNQNYQPVNNGYPTPEKKKGNPIKTIVIVVGCLFLAVVLFCIAFYLGTKKPADTSTGGENSGVETTPQATVQTYKATFQGFELTIPVDLISTVNGTALLLVDDSQTWIASLQIGQQSYNTLKRNMSRIPAVYEQQGFLVENVDTRTITGTEFLTFEAFDGATNYLVAFSELTAAYTAGVEIINNANSFEYDVIEKITPIIKNATYTGASNSISIDNDIILEEIFEEE